MNQLNAESSQSYLNKSKDIENPTLNLKLPLNHLQSMLFAINNHHAVFFGSLRFHFFIGDLTFSPFSCDDRDWIWIFSFYLLFIILKELIFDCVGFFFLLFLFFPFFFWNIEFQICRFVGCNRAIGSSVFLSSPSS